MQTAQDELELRELNARAEVNELATQLRHIRDTQGLSRYPHNLVTLLDAAWAPPKDIVMHDLKMYIDWRPPALCTYNELTRVAHLAGVPYAILPETTWIPSDYRHCTTYAHVIVALRGGVFIPANEFLATYYAARWGDDSDNSVTKMAAARSELYKSCNKPYYNEMQLEQSANDVMCDTALDVFRTSLRVKTILAKAVNPYVDPASACIIVGYIVVCDLDRTIYATNTELRRGMLNQPIEGVPMLGANLVIMSIAGIMYGSWTHPEKYEALLRIKPDHNARNNVIEWYRLLSNRDRALLRVDSDLTLIDRRFAQTDTSSHQRRMM